MPTKADRNAADLAAARQSLMRCCALATEAELASAIDAFEAPPAVTDVRTPETGLVMLRGRVGGDGAPFNVGETTVTRAVVRLASGEVGHAYLLGRSQKKARLAATIDALGQSEKGHTKLAASLIEPVNARVTAEQEAKREETAKTRVNFFTLVRGED